MDQLHNFRQLLDYDASTGTFIWKTRQGNKSWNTRFAGTVAGSVRPDGYVGICIRSKPYLAHRLVWLFEHGEWPSSLLDHRDGDRARNHISNLREATHSQNLLNSISRSKHRGVERNGSGWRARMQIDSKVILGTTYRKKTSAFVERLIMEQQHLTDFLPRRS